MDVRGQASQGGIDDPTNLPRGPLDFARRGQREEEKAAQIIAAFAADVDGVMIRGAKAIKRLEALDAEPNLIVAARRALDSLNEVGRALRREGLLSLPQQRLL